MSGELTARTPGAHPLLALHARLTEMSEPLSEAFDSRLRAINPGMPMDSDRSGSEMLLVALMGCIQHADNIVELLPLASELAQQNAGGGSAVGVCRHAVQALDWSIRDMLMDQYSVTERVAFTECTGLFIELLRRTGTSETDSNNDSPAAATLS
jgi:hypothetical protein